MTLIAALSCRDGCVLAADSQETMVDGQNLQARQSIEKVAALGNVVLWSATGDAAVKGAVQRRFAQLPPDVVAQGLGELQAYVETIMTEIRAAVVRKFQLIRGPTWTNAAEGLPELELVMVDWVAGRSRILRVSKDGMAVEEQGGIATEGNAMVVALPTLNHYYHGDISLKEGILLAYRAVGDATDCIPALVGRPVSVWAVSGESGRETVTRLSEQELAGLDETCREWRRRDRATLEELAGG